MFGFNHEIFKSPFYKKQTNLQIKSALFFVCKMSQESNLYFYFISRRISPFSSGYWRVNCSNISIFLLQILSGKTFRFSAFSMINFLLQTEKFRNLKWVTYRWIDTNPLILLFHSSISQCLYLVQPM